MRPVLFVLCFSLGVALMILSGYVPQAARAGGHESLAADSSDDRPPRVEFEQPVRPQPVLGEEIEVARVPDLTPDDEPGNTPPPPSDEVGRHEPDEPAGVPNPDELLSVLDDEAAPGTSTPDELIDWMPPIANAGVFRVVWCGWNEVRLDGSGSSGEGLSYQWKQTSGPLSLHIANADKAVATASGFAPAGGLDWGKQVYEFALTVTDARGEQDTDYMECVVKSAPTLEVDPPAERRFEVRDGYELAHFESWITNLETDSSTFEIISPTRLIFTKVGGGAYEVAEDADMPEEYVYTITLYYVDGAPTSWVELFVDTEEKIPGVLILGVNWES